MPRHRDAAVAHHLLEEVLVHRERGCGHPGADVRDIGEIEQPLHSAVLAERAVQDRQDDVDDAEPLERAAVVRDRQRPCDGLPGPELPPAVAPDRDLGDVVPRRIERLEHGAGRRERDVVLARTAAGEQRHAQPAGRHGVVVVAVVVAVVAGHPPDGHRPTLSVTVEPGFACFPVSGLWSRTIWS